MKLVMFIYSLLFLVVASTCHADYRQMIYREAKSQGLDPNIALAVVKVESDFNPYAVGSMGEIGLFQIRPEYARIAVYNPNDNIKEGIRQLIYWRDNCPVKEGFTWVSCFNQGARHPKYPKLHPYYKKVHRALSVARLGAR